MSLETHTGHYTAMSKDLPSDETLPMEDLKRILGIGLDFAVDLINKKRDVASLIPQDGQFNHALAENVLMRLNMLYSQAVTKGIEKADSIVLFGQLRLKVCEGMHYEEESLTESTLNSLFDKSFKLFLKDELDPAVDIKRIRILVSRIVPNNPQTEVQNVHKHTLD